MGVLHSFDREKLSAIGIAMSKVIVRIRDNPEWKFTAYLSEIREKKFVVWSSLDEKRRVEFHFPKETHFFEKAE